MRIQNSLKANFIPICWTAISALVLFVGLNWAESIRKHYKISVEVRAKVSGVASLVVQANELPELQRLITIVPSANVASQVYLASGLTTDLHSVSLRAERGARVEVESIRLIRSRGENVHIGVEWLEQCYFRGDRKYRQDAPVPRQVFESVAAPMQLTCGVRMVPNSTGAFADFLHHFFWVILGFFLFLQFLFTASRQERFQILSVVGVSAVVLLSLRGVAALVLSFRIPPAPVALAVGRSSFEGISKPLEMATYGSTIAVAILLGLLAAFWMRRHVRRDLSTTDPEPTPLTVRSAHLFYLALLLLVFLLVSFPPLSAIYLKARSGAPLEDLDWDKTNIFTWQYNAFRGWLPYRDYWFPYGGTFDSLGKSPSSLLRAFGHDLLLAAVFLVAVWTSVRRNLWRVSVVTAVTAVVIASRTLISPSRYLMSLLAMLLFYGFWKATPNPRRFAWIWGAFFTWCFAYEISQLVYPLPAIAVIAILGMVWAPNRGLRRERALALLLGGAVAIAGGILFISLLAWRQQLPGFLQFVMRMKTLSVYSSAPNPELLRWYDFSSPLPPALFLAGTHLFLFWGCAWVFCRRAANDSIRGAELLLGLGLVSAMLGTKQIVRPDISSQALWPVGFGLLLLGTGIPFAPQFRRRVVAATISVGILGSVYQGAFQTLWVQWFSEHENFVTALATRIQHRAEFPAIEEDFHTLRRRPQFASEVEDFTRRLAAPLAANRERPLYILGDDNFLYIATDKKPAFHVCLYSNSPIWDQQDTVAWLAREQPIVVVKPGEREFDAVPHAVRLPEIFGHVVRNYVPIARSTKYVLLDRKPAGEPVALEFWREHLGEVLSLGHLPALSRVAEFPLCRTAGPNCRPVLEVALVASPKRAVEVPVSVMGKAFRLRFSAAPNRDYAILLDRVWFWGEDASILPAEGLHWKIRYREVPHDRLY